MSWYCGTKKNRSTKNANYLLYKRTVQKNQIIRQLSMSWYCKTKKTRSTKNANCRFVQKNCSSRLKLSAYVSICQYTFHKGNDADCWEVLAVVSSYYLLVRIQMIYLKETFHHQVMLDLEESLAIIFNPLRIFFQNFIWINSTVYSGV